LLLVLVLGIAYSQGATGDALWFGAHTIGPFVFHPLVAMYLVSGSLMISTLRIPKP
jgi:CDP-diacylglycerol--serine O-phosphatidyltransferase